MTEAEWLDCTDPGKMLEFLRAKASDRKLRLFAVACCRELDPGMGKDHPAHIAVEVAERYVEGVARQEELEAAPAAAEGARYAHWAEVFDQRRPATQSEVREGWLARMARWASETRDAAAARGAAEAAADRWYMSRLGRQGWGDKFARLLHETVGNPFRPATLDPAWRTPDVLSLAHAAYDNRTLPSGTLEPDRLALLADALEDAGCASADLLGHLRGAGVHVRGCWAVDLVLGKS
jgi:hypothetical protein